MILEGLVSTRNDDGSPNFAPMGPHVDRELTTITLKPFCSSRTFQNLQRNPQCVLHVVDDVLLLARAAINHLDDLPATVPAEKIDGFVLRECCRWFELEILDCQVAHERATLRTRIVHSGRKRDFFGFNRAKHAVLEAAILATRIAILPAGEILDQLARLKVPVEKTAGDDERDAFLLLATYIESALRSQR